MSVSRMAATGAGGPGQHKIWNCREMSIFERDNFSVEAKSTKIQLGTNYQFSCAIANNCFWCCLNALLKRSINISGGCCRNIVVRVDQQDTDVLTESISWCRSNPHVGVDQVAFNSKNHWQVLETMERCSKRERNNCWRFAVILMLNWHMYS